MYDKDQVLPSPPPSKGLLHKSVIHILIISALGLLAYSNTLHGPFQWDEADYIVNNPFIRNLDYFAQPSRAKGLLDDALVSRYVGFLTFALNYRIHGFDVVGYHIVNLAIHIINAILVYFLVMLTFRTPFFRGPGTGDQGPGISNQGRPVPSPQSPVPGPQLIALAVALLFVAHPVQTEAVTYVFQRFASLVSLFYLLSLVLYIKGRLSAISTQHSANSRFTIHDSRFTILWYLLSLLAAVLAMKTKENAFTLPVIIALYEFLFFSGPLKPRVLRLLPFLLTLLIVPVTIIVTESGHTTGEIMSQIKDPASLGYQKLSRVEYLFTQFRVIATYIRLLFLPVNQNINYNYPGFRSFFDSSVILSFLFLAAVLGSGVYLLYRSRHAGKLTCLQAAGPMERDGFHYPLFTVHYSRLVAFGILWFFITLSVESSVIPIPMVINEYRIYLPSVGFFLALVAGVVLLLKHSSRFTIHDSRSAKIAAALFVVVIVVLASATYARNVLWTDKVSLWEDVVRKSPDSPRGYNNLGLAYYEKGQHEKAIAAYEYCIALFPSYRTAYINLGVAYAVTGRTNAAIENFRRGVEIDPENSIAYANLARAYSESGRYAEAVDNYLKAVELNPALSSAFHGLGIAYVKLGRFDDALFAYTKFAELSPYDPEAYRNRAFVYADKGDLNNAKADFQKACSLGSRESCGILMDSRLR